MLVYIHPGHYHQYLFWYRKRNFDATSSPVCSDEDYLLVAMPSPQEPPTSGWLII